MNPALSEVFHEKAHWHHAVSARRSRYFCGQVCLREGFLARGRAGPTGRRLRTPHAAIKWPRAPCRRNLAARRCPPSCEMRLPIMPIHGKSRGRHMPLRPPPPGPKWCPSGVQRAPKSHGGGNGRSAARRLCRQVGGLQGRSGKGYARSRDCDVGWLEPVERPAGQPFQRASQRACLVQCGNEVPTAALTASPPVPNLGPKHANAALLQLRKCEGKSGRSGRRDGGRGSIEISGHWPSCRPGLLWHWSSYRR